MVSVSVCPCCQDLLLPYVSGSGSGTRYGAVRVKTGLQCTAVTPLLCVRWLERWRGGWRRRHIRCPLPLSAPEETLDSKWVLSSYNFTTKTGQGQMRLLIWTAQRINTVWLELTLKFPEDPLENKPSQQGWHFVNSILCSVVKRD